MGDKDIPKTPVAKPRMVEITCIASFPNPFKTQAAEIAGMKIGAANPGANPPGWAPSTDDFNAVAEADVKDNKAIFSVSNTGELIGAMQTAPPGTLARVNLITHSNSSILPLSGTITDKGEVFFNGQSDPSRLKLPRINTDFIDYLNGKASPQGGDPDGKTLRADLRALLRSNAEFFFYGCDGGAANSFLVMQELGICLGMATHGFQNFIDFQPQFDEKKGIIFKASRARTRYQNVTNISARDPNLIAPGFRHLVPDKNIPMPATLAP